MARITIQDILGTDNVGASRPVIMSNFKILADAINRMQAFLNTSPSGGQLNVGSLNIERFSQPITTELLRLEASARIDGRLRVGQSITVGTGSSDPESSFATDLSIGRALRVGNPTGIAPPINVSRFGMGLSLESLLILGSNSFAAFPAGTISVLEGSGATTQGRNNIVIDWSSTSTATLSNGTHGQILIVRSMTSALVSSTYTLNGPGGAIALLQGITSTNASKANVTLMFVATNPSSSLTAGSWVVIGVGEGPGITIDVQ